MTTLNETRILEDIFGKELLGVSLDILTYGPMKKYFPPDNRAGADILFNYLQAELVNAGYGFHDPDGLSLSYGAELNRAEFVFAVANFDRAVAVVQTLLDRCGIGQFATLFRFDPAESAFRRVAGKGDPTAFTPQRLAAARQCTAESFAALNAAAPNQLREIPPPAPTQTDSPNHNPS